MISRDRWYDEPREQDDPVTRTLQLLDAPPAPPPMVTYTGDADRDAAALDPDLGPHESGPLPFSPLSPSPEPVTPPPPPETAHQPSFAPEDYSSQVMAPPAPQETATAPFQDTYSPEPPPPAVPNQVTRYVPSYAPQAAQVTPEMAPRTTNVIDVAGEAVQAGAAAAEPYLTGPARTEPTWGDPFAPVREVGQHLREHPLGALPAAIYGDVQGAAADVIGRRTGEAAGLSDEKQPYEVPGYGTVMLSQQDLSGIAGQLLLDPYNFAGLPAAWRAGKLGRGILEAIPGVGELMLAGQGLAAAGRGGLGAVRRIAGELADPTLPAARSADYLGTTLHVPEGSAVRARKLADAGPMPLGADEVPRFVEATDAVSAGRMGPGSAEHLDPAHPVEWHDVTVDIRNGGQHDGQHPVTLPFFRNANGDLIPLEPPNPGGMGSPVNSAFNAAVKAAGGRKGYVYGYWHDASGRAHKFDSPAEIAFFHEADREKAAGTITDWWSEEHIPFPDVQEIPYPSSNRDKGGLKAYKPDLLVRYPDGTLEVREVKPAKVLEGQEEYGIKAGEVSGHMGWAVATKAAGIIAGLADRGIRYRLLLPNRIAERALIPLGPNRVGQGMRTRRPDLIPGVDPRDAARLRGKAISPEAGSIGNEVGRIIDATSDEAVAHAAELRAAGVPDAERYERLTRLVRDRILPTADLVGRREGKLRPIAAGGVAELPSWFAGRGPLSLEDLAEYDPDLAERLGRVAGHGAEVSQIAVHDVALPDGRTVPRLDVAVTGDPQATVLAMAEIGDHLGESGRVGYWYPDDKGPFHLRRTDLASGGLTRADAEAIIHEVTGGWDGAPRASVRYNSRGEVEGIDLLGRADDGRALEERELAAANRRLDDALRARGLDPTHRGPEKAEASHYGAGQALGERGHPESVAAGREMAERFLGKRPTTMDEVEAARAAERERARARRALARGGAAGPAAAATDDPVVRHHLDRIDAADDLDDLPDLGDELEYGASLVGPLPPGLGRSGPPGAGPTGLAGAVGQQLSSRLPGAVTGSLLGAGLPTEGEDDGRATRAGVGALVGGLVGPSAARAAARGGGRGLNMALGATTGGGGGGLGPLVSRWQAATTKAARQASAARAAGLAPPPTAMDWLRSIGYSAMIGPSTGIVNAVGNGTELLWHLPKDLTRALVRGKPGEAALEGRGLLAGLMRSGGEMLDALAGAHPGGGVETARLSQRATSRVGQVAAGLLEAPTRIFSEVPDAFYRSIAETMGEYRAAGQIASDMGLTGQKWSSYVDTLLKDAEYARANPATKATSANIRRVLDEGRQLGERLTLRGETGQLGQKMKDLIRATGPVGHLVFPFFNTPYQMTQRMLERTPGLGARMGTQPHRFDRVYDQVAGSALLAGMTGLAAGGLISGSGPDDPEKRKALVSQGWAPNSTLVGGVWVPNNAFGVFGPMLDTVGEAGDALRHGKDPGFNRDTLTDARKRAGRIVTNQVYLRGLSDILKAIDSPGEQFEAYAASLAGRALPLGATARLAATAQDPYQRRAEPAREVGTIENVRQRLGRSLPDQLANPVLPTRGQLPIDQDILGRPVENEQAGPAALGPRTRTPRPDPVLERFGAAGVDIGSPRTDITEDGVKVDLSPAETRRWNELRGEEVTKATMRLIENGLLDRMNPVRQKERLEEVKAEASDRATERLRREIGAAEFSRRRRAARQLEGAGAR